MYTILVITMKTRNLALSALIFASGVIASNRVQHAIANFRSNEPVPYVHVRYTRDSAFVNNERVFANRIGEARCDWQDIMSDERLQYTLSEMQQNNQVIPNYLRNAPAEDIKHFTYASLAQLARRAGNTVSMQVDSMRISLGYRWDMNWNQNTENAR